MAQIDPEMIEAGRVDGAGNLRILFSLVLPSLRPITISLAILNLITALKLFDNVWLITQGGPANSSAFLGTMIYSETASSDRNIGYASALSIILLVIAVTASVVIQLRSRERTASKPLVCRRCATMFETRSRRLARVLQLVLTIAVIPFADPHLHDGRQVVRGRRLGELRRRRRACPGSCDSSSTPRSSRAGRSSSSTSRR